MTRSHPHPHPHPRSALPLSVALTAAAACLTAQSACTIILDLPDPVTAYRWCLDAAPAQGRSNANFAIYGITHPDSGTWMRGCTCYCPADHELMILGANGQLAPGSDDETAYLNALAQLRAKAELACTERVLEMQTEQGAVLTFADPETVTCAAAVADDEPYYTTECVLNTDICPGAPTVGGSAGQVGTSGDAGATTHTDDSSTSVGPGADESDGGNGGTGGTGGGAMAYGLDDWVTVIDCTTVDRCDVEAAFVDELLQDLSVFEGDVIRVRPSAVSDIGHRGFLFTRLGPASFPAALGFRAGDLLWAVDDIELRSLADVGRAFEDLDRATVVHARLDRDGETLTRTYRLVPAAPPR